MRRLGLALVLTALLLVCAAPASAATGDLSFKDCIAKFVASPCTAVPNEVLEGARDVAVSPDGKLIYVADSQDSVVGFKRSLVDGSVSYAGCVDSGDDTGCTHLGTNVLQAPRSLAFSPGGEFLYVSTETSDTVVRFEVGADGALSLAGCAEDDALPDWGCGTEVAALENPYRVIASQDGSSVYVSSAEAAVTHLSPSLQLLSCYREVTITGCETQAEPLESPYGLAISPGGKHLYVTSVGRDAITRFTRGLNGTLTLSGCISDDDDATAFSDSCSEDSGVNYDWLNHITFNSTGSHAYVTDETGVGVVYHFTRDATTGALARQDCLADDKNFDAPGCTELDDATGSALASVTDAVVSPDDANLYAVARQDPALTTFGLASPSGALSHIRCLRASAFEGCAGFVTSTVLSGPFGIAVSPDGHDVYVANETGVPALLHFEREAPGTRPDEEGPGPDPGPGPGPGSDPGPTPSLPSTSPPGPPPPPPKPAARCAGLKATIVGTGGANTLKGTPKRDVIAAGAGNDKVQGLGGKDVVCGEGGNDNLNGGPGADNLIGGPGKDTLKGGPDKDLLNGGPGKDVAKQ